MIIFFYYIKMENPKEIVESVESVEVLKAKMDNLIDNLKTLRKQIKNTNSREYSKEYAKKRYYEDEAYRNRQNENAKARYHRLKELKNKA
jgi:hypothetical protein